jgi:L-asparaginase II
MANPVVVEVLRGERIESRHRGAAVVADPDGGVVLSIGDVDRPVYPRSAIKALQALQLIESGAADRFGFGDEELALACASHGGEPAHVAGVMRMLSAAGLDHSTLQCGAHWPTHQASARALARAGEMPSALHNNCSGKHAGFLCTACAIGCEPAGYVAATHPIQREAKRAIETISGVQIDDEPAVDGCSVPTWALPLTNLARAFARLGTGHGLSPQRAQAACRLRKACAAKPWFVAGTDRFCTEVMGHFGERVFVKTGAEGVYCAALPEQGFGIAIKCDDGTSRAAEILTATLVARLVKPEGSDRTLLDRLMHPTLCNWNGIVVGSMRPTDIVTGGV